MDATNTDDALHASNQKLDEELAALTEENRELRELLARKRAFVEKLRKLVPEIESEKAAIDIAFSRLAARS